MASNKWQQRFIGQTKDFGLKISLLIIFTLIFSIFVWYANDGVTVDFLAPPRETARVLEILTDHVVKTDSGVIDGTMDVVVMLETGAFSGQAIQSVYNLNLSNPSRLVVGDRVSVSVSVAEDGQLSRVHIMNPERREAVIFLFLIFVAVLALIGGKRGIRSLISLGFTVVAIVFLLVPLMLQGYAVLPMTVLILTGIIVFSLLMLNGMQKKTISAMLGCFFGLLITWLFANLGGTIAHISGFHLSQVELIIATLAFPIDQASGLFISGVLIASTGAVMDTAVSISSTAAELKEQNPKIKVRQLFKGAMNVGRDTMGTMTTTLILAFAGSSLNMLLLIYGQGSSFNSLINSEFMVIEIIRSLAGSIGLILTIPAVAVISSLME